MNEMPNLMAEIAKPFACVALAALKRSTSAIRLR